jgi:hypothetical protein
MGTFHVQFSRLRVNAHVAVRNGRRVQTATTLARQIPACTAKRWRPSWRSCTGVFGVKRVSRHVEA